MIDKAKWKKMSLSAEQVRRVKLRAVQEKPYAERISLALAVDLLLREQERGDYFPVLDAIDHLEGLQAASLTKDASQFTRGPLAPLWHKHFAGPRSIAMNIKLHLGRPGVIENMFAEASDESGDDQNLLIRSLSHKLSVQAWKERIDQGMGTGEWLVYAKHGGCNHYLVAVPHGCRSLDWDLHRQIGSECFGEWPWLFPDGWEKDT